MLNSTSSAFKQLFLLLFLFLIPTSYSQSHVILPVGQSPVSCYSSSKGVATYYTFSFSIPSSIKSNAFLSILFPSEFPVGLLAPSSTGLECGYMSPYYTALSCFIKDGRTVVFNMATLQAGSYQLVIGQIVNPTSFESSSSFKVYTYQVQGLIDYNENLGKMAFSNPPSKFLFFLKILRKNRSNVLCICLCLWGPASDLSWHSIQVHIYPEPTGRSWQLDQNHLSSWLQLKTSELFG